MQQRQYDTHEDVYYSRMSYRPIRHRFHRNSPGIPAIHYEPSRRESF